MNKLDAHNNAERRPPSWPKLNQLLFDLGSDVAKEEDVEYVKNYIAALDKQFDLGLFAFSCEVLTAREKELLLSFFQCLKPI